MATSLLMSTTSVTSACQEQLPARSKPRARKPKRPSIAAILRESYRLYMSDRETRQAVKACLRSA